MSIIWGVGITATLLTFTTSSVHGFRVGSGRVAVTRIARCPTACSRQRLICQAEVQWSSAKIASNEPEAEGTRVLVVEAPNAVEGYSTPGQFVQIKSSNGGPSFFAIANSPQKSKETGRFEFLVKEAESNAWLCQSKAGATLDISGVQGNGFRIAEELTSLKYDFPVQNILLVCTGTGVAPIRAAIESGLLETSSKDPFGRSCRLYLGVRSPEALPYKEELGSWEARGVEVVPVFSRTAGSDPAARSGYVQDAIKADGIRVPRNTGVLLVGQKEMANSVKELCGAANVFPGRVLLNF